MDENTYTIFNPNSKSSEDDSKVEEYGAGDSAGQPLISPVSSLQQEPTAPNYNNAENSGTTIPNRIFVKGFSCLTTEAELTRLFTLYGEVIGSKIVMDNSGYSKGYGFVTFKTEKEATKLVNDMKNKEMPPIVHRNRRLIVGPALEKQRTHQHVTYEPQRFAPPPPPHQSFWCGQPQFDFYAATPPPPTMQANPTTYYYGPQGYGGPPFDPNYLNQGQLQGVVSLLPFPDFSQQQSNGILPPLPPGSFYATMPNHGLGYGSPGPNGTFIFSPLY